MASNFILSMIDDGDPRRTARRRRVLLTATLSTATNDYQVRLRDISHRGARIEGEGLPPMGSVVVLRRGTFQVYGELVWVNGDSGGVAFDEPLDEAELMERIKGMPAPAAESEPYRRPGFTRERRARWSDGSGWVDARPRR